MAIPAVDLHQLAVLARTLGAKRERTHDQEIYLLRALSQQAQLFDYYGRYQEAEEAIMQKGAELESAMEQRRLDRVERVKSEQLVLLTFYSHCFYRRDDFKRTRQLLEAIRRELERSFPLCDPLKKRLWKLRQRVAYSLAQAHRQSGANIKEARAEFLAAMEFTRKGLAEELSRLGEEPEKEADRLREKMYANYQLGKALAFGLSWCSSNSGEVQRARGSAAAGSALLKTTNDKVHSAYAEVLYVQALRSATLPVEPGAACPAELTEALEILKPLVDDKHSPLQVVKRLLYRAKYELVAVQQAAGRFEEAEAGAREIYSSEAKTPWHVHAGVYYARLLLERRNDAAALSKALEVSQNLLDLDLYEGSPSLHAEALLCRADVLMHVTTINFAAVHDALLHAQTLALESPLIVAQCHLYRARCFCKQENLDAAWRELGMWDAMADHGNIQHGWVLNLANRVKEELHRKDVRFVADASRLGESGGFSSIQRDLQRWAIQKLYHRFGKDYLRPEHTRAYLGMSPSGVRLWMKETGFDPSK
ncbi:MAG TPA: hypothetical protein VKS01_11730 [Bryobacteraceae bacterium]|nr:hypothetical protein [Bryobacteraceae bacterium]